MLITKRNELIIMVLNVIFLNNLIFIIKPIKMEDKETKKGKKKIEDLETKLDEFLEEEEEKECVGEECLINDGKEIIERVNKVYKTTDGRQLLI